MRHDLSHLLVTLTGAGQMATLCSIGLILFGALMIKVCWRRRSGPWDA